MSPRAQSRGLKNLLMKFYYVYMLRCNDKSIYTGITSNLDKRIFEHSEGKHKNSYTYSRRPISLVYYQEFTNPEQAIAFEKRLKKWSRVKKEALIKDNYDLIQSFSECRNATHYKYKPND